MLSTDWMFPMTDVSDKLEEADRELDRLVKARSMINLQDIEYPLRLCVEMMHFAALGANGKTEDMRASEIKDALRVFFTDEQINESVQILSGTQREVNTDD